MKVKYIICFCIAFLALLGLICSLFLKISALKKRIRKEINVSYKKQMQYDLSIIHDLSMIKKKLSFKDDIARNGKYLFYVPNYPYEMLQNYAVDSKDVFYELSSLQTVDKLLPKDAVILDIGANIGNHTIYWLLESPKKAKHVYAFEVIDETFNILKKNIELNGLKNKTTLFNFGLGANNTNASISSILSTEGSFINMGSTSIQEDKKGKFKIKKLDDVVLKHKVDFVKIDVEGFELEVIKGAQKLLMRDKPLIWVELWDEDGKEDPRYTVGNKAEFDKMMKKLGYERFVQLDVRNFVYKNFGKTEK